jgi:hypothetical protein
MRNKAEADPKSKDNHRGSRQRLIAQGKIIPQREGRKVVKIYRDEPKKGASDLTVSAKEWLHRRARLKIARPKGRRRPSTNRKVERKGSTKKKQERLKVSSVERASATRRGEDRALEAEEIVCARGRDRGRSEVAAQLSGTEHDSRRRKSRSIVEYGIRCRSRNQGSD